MGHLGEVSQGTKVEGVKEVQSEGKWDGNQ